MKTKEEIEQKIKETQKTISSIEKQREELLKKTKTISEADFLLEWDIITCRLRVFGSVINNLKWIIE